MRRLTAVLLAVLSLAGPAVARDDADREFGDWWVGCDNVRVCTAYGFATEDGDGVALRVRRGAGRGAPPVFDVILGSEQSEGVEGALELLVDGKAVGRTGLPQEAADAFRAWDVPGGEALAAAIAQGSVLTLKVGDRAVATVSLAGSSAALRWMDDQQKRAGGVTALVAKGPASAAALPPLPALPLVRAARAVDQEGLGEIPPPAVLKLARTRDCSDDPPDGPTAARLAPGIVMWIVPCWVGPYNVTSVLVLADEKGAHARLADLGGADPAEERAMATNAEYDAEHQSLYSYAKGPGAGDCGISFTHVWTGRGFVLASRSELSACRGLPGDFWVDTYRSR